jgi:hypothetical protein
LRDLIRRFSDSALARAARRRKIPWYCFALTYTGSSSISLGSITRADATPATTPPPIAAGGAPYAIIAPP